MATERYRKNAGAVFTLKYHLVWCPKYRKSILGGELAKRLKEVLHVKARELEIVIEALAIELDHVHMFVNCDPTLAPAQVAAQFKGFTSRVLREEFPWLKSRLPSLWSRSYFIATVGHVSEATVKKYIANQKTKPDKTDKE
jgi:putative transposase